MAKVEIFVKKDRLKKYIAVVRLLISGKMSADEFTDEFLEIRRNDRDYMTSLTEYTILELETIGAIFTSVDSFCGENQTPESKGEIDTDEFFAECKNHLADLIYLKSRIKSTK